MTHQQHGPRLGKALRVAAALGAVTFILTGCTPKPQPVAVASTVEQIPASVGPSSAAPSLSTPSPSPQTPLFQTVTSVSLPGRAYGNDHLVLTADGDTYTSWSPQGELKGSATLAQSDDACISQDLDAGRIVVTDSTMASHVFRLTQVTVPPQGTLPARREVSLTSYGEDLQQEWTLSLGTFDYHADHRCLSDLSATTNGDWIALNFFDFPATYGDTTKSWAVHGWVRVADHLLKATEVSVKALANRILTNHCQPCTEGYGLDDDYSLINPSTGATRSVAHNGKRDYSTAGILRFVEQGLSTQVDADNWVILEDGSGLVRLDLDSLDITRSSTSAQTYTGRHILTDTTHQVAAMDADSVFRLGASIDRLWSLPTGATLCALGAGSTIISINHQLAELRTSDGSQVSYTSELTECPSYIFGSYGWYADGTIVAILAAIAATPPTASPR